MLDATCLICYLNTCPTLQSPTCQKLDYRRLEVAALKSWNWKRSGNVVKALRWNIHPTCCCSFNNFNWSLTTFSSARSTFQMRKHLSWNLSKIAGMHFLQRKTNFKKRCKAAVMAWASPIIRLQIAPNTSNILHNEIALVNQWADKKLRSLKEQYHNCFILTQPLKTF